MHSFSLLHPFQSVCLIPGGPSPFRMMRVQSVRPTPFDRAGVVHSPLPLRCYVGPPKGGANTTNTRCVLGFVEPTVANGHNNTGKTATYAASLRTHQPDQVAVQTDQALGCKTDSNNLPPAAPVGAAVLRRKKVVLPQPRPHRLSFGDGHFGHTRHWGGQARVAGLRHEVDDFRVEPSLSRRQLGRLSGRRIVGNDNA
jgi:hypothetical protein